MPRGAARPHAVFFNLSRLSRPSRKNDLKFLLKPDVDPRTGKRRSGFGKLAKQKREKAVRIRSLKAYTNGLAHSQSTQSSKVAAASLAALMTAARKPGDLASLADPLFMRELRRRLLGETLRLVGNLPAEQVRFYTIAAPSWKFPGKRLNRFSAKKLLESLRTNLARTGHIARLTGWAMIFFHGEFDSATDSYHPHFHVVVVGEKYLAFEALRDLKLFRGGKGKAVYRPIQRDPLGNAPRQISYLLKSYWPAKASYLNLRTGGNRRSRKGRRIPQPRHTETLLWLNEQRFSDVAWLHGVSIKGGRLTIKKRAH